LEHKILKNEVINKEFKDFLLIQFDASRENLSDSYKKILDLFARNQDFLKYFEGIDIKLSDKKIIHFPENKIVRPNTVNVAENKLSKMEAKVDSLIQTMKDYQLKIMKLEEIINKSSKVKRINQDESSIIEHKASIWTPYPKFPKKEGDFYHLGKEKFSGEKQVYNFIKNQTLKAIVAFLNSNGGEIIIGIHEQNNHKEYVGIEYDLRNEEKFNSKDSYQQFINSQISNYILPLTCRDFVHVKIEEEQNVELCIIKVKKIPQKHQPARLLDKKEEKIYIRNGNATEHIIGNKLIRYFEKLRR